MKATFSSYGQPEEVIELSALELSPLPDHQVKVKILAAPINPADINYVQGSYGIKPELPSSAGLEGCGVVTESKSKDFTSGDKVIFTGRVGTWAKEVITHSENLLKIPEQTPTEQASMLKVNPLTAWCILTQLRTLPNGSWIIQNAANSGVGYCVIQIAKLIGLKTINLVRRAELLPELEAIGGDINLLDNAEYINTLPEQKPLLAINAVGGDSALRMMEALAPKGLHITYGAMSMRSLKVPNKFLIFKGIQIQGFWITEWIKEQDPEFVKCSYLMLAQLMIDQSLAQPIDSSFPLSEIHSALSRAKTSKRNGKVLLEINNSN